MMGVLFFDILLFPLFNVLFNFNYFLIQILSGVVGSRAQILNFLVFLLDVDQAHDWAVVALSKEDFNDLSLVLLRLFQALDLLRLFLYDFLKMLKQQCFQHLFIFVFLNRW